ncbi:hypothetical protein PNEG_02786 [Pneumocystis murina B123]|uniref:NAD-dependent epimerase/dehydratase domain-containing protein n=1 Tax=Pneumocystis murina (strain B123) TaxID=1069680 RepID=M7NPI6_PNEMU|nr:hypothetical protein PNEG_02786 [Pneumocystis murina B123]EMR09011.1 hypothetical protein PNEG_02786 [Pneumocystis murina B123]
MNHHLAVFGGTGFLGQHICKTAIQKGWTVTSISRRGMPNSDQHNGNIQNWTQEVNWCKGDLNDPISIENHVKSASAIIYSVGTLLENRYKRFLSGRDSLFSLFQLSQDEDLSYDKLNRDFAIQIADMASQMNKNIPFVYLSAANTFPGIPRKYIESKREAEDYICSVQNIRPIIMRPGFIYSKERPISLPLAGIIDITSNISKLFCRKISFLGAAGVKPLKVETVANAIIQSIHEEFKGIASVEHIEKLASVLQKTRS